MASQANEEAVKQPTCEEVLNVFKELGVPQKKVKKISKCLLAGVFNGFVKLLPPSKDATKKWGLNQVLCKGKCPGCCKEYECTIKKMMYQEDWGGDYEDGSEGATFKCKDCDQGLYVADVCCGEPGFSDGKFFNHCDQHPGFGYCIGDYRETHCDRCGNHYHGYFLGPKACYHCNDGEESGDSSE